MYDKSLKLEPCVSAQSATSRLVILPSTGGFFNVKFEVGFEEFTGVEFPAGPRLLNSVAEKGNGSPARDRPHRTPVLGLEWESCKGTILGLRGIYAPSEAKGYGFAEDDAKGGSSAKPVPMSAKNTRLFAVFRASIRHNTNGPQSLQ